MAPGKAGLSPSGVASPLPAMTPREELLLAYGVVEYDTALTHLAALRRVGEPVPWSVIGRLQSERSILLLRWRGEHGNAVMRPDQETVNEVRQWLSEHVEELDALLEEEQRDSKQGRGVGDTGSTEGG